MSLNEPKFVGFDCDVQLQIRTILRKHSSPPVQEISLK